MPDADIIPIDDERNARRSTESSRAEVERKLAGALAFLRRRIEGDYEVDEFGYDSELTHDVLIPMLKPLYEKWFRVEVHGIENVPSEGGALVVANHSGTIALDSLMTQVALAEHHSAHRELRMLGADLVFSLPVIGPLADAPAIRLRATPTPSVLWLPARWSVFGQERASREVVSLTPSVTSCSGSVEAASCRRPSARGFLSFPRQSWVPRRSTP